MFHLVQSTKHHKYVVALLTLVLLDVFELFISSFGMAEWAEFNIHTSRIQLTRLIVLFKFRYLICVEYMHHVPHLCPVYADCIISILLLMAYADLPAFVSIMVIF